VLDRYYNVLPYDHSRVRLKYLDREIYINANYVRVPEANRKYILTQGKLQYVHLVFITFIQLEKIR
jgi:protein tyrosine phosphatase